MFINQKRSRSSLREEGAMEKWGKSLLLGAGRSKIHELGGFNRIYSFKGGRSC